MLWTSWCVWCSFSLIMSWLDLNLSSTSLLWTVQVSWTEVSIYQHTVNWCSEGVIVHILTVAKQVSWAVSVSSSHKPTLPVFADFFHFLRIFPPFHVDSWNTAFEESSKIEHFLSANGCILDPTGELTTLCRPPIRLGRGTAPPHSCLPSAHTDSSFSFWKVGVPTVYPYWCISIQHDLFVHSVFWCSGATSSVVNAVMWSCGRFVMPRTVNWRWRPRTERTVSRRKIWRRKQRLCPVVTWCRFDSFSRMPSFFICDVLKFKYYHHVLSLLCFDQSTCR